MCKCIGKCNVLHQRGEENINIGFLILVNAEESQFVVNLIPLQFSFDIVGAAPQHSGGRAADAQICKTLSTLFPHCLIPALAWAKPPDGQRKSSDRKCTALLLLLLGSSAFSVVLFLLCNFHFLTNVELLPQP